MNIRGKSSPVQSNIRSISTPTRGQTPPPPAQLRGSHFDDPSSHYPSHFQAAGAPYQSSQAYVDMNKPASGRVSGPGLAQGPQGFNVQRAQHSFNLVGDAQDQPAPQMWSNPPGSYYLTPGQNMRQQRMPTAMNNSQVAFMPGMTGNMPNMAFVPGSMAPSYSGNQGMPFVQNPGNQFMQYPQPRMPFPAAAMPQQQQMGFIPQYGPTSTAYAAPNYYPSPMSMPSTSRPSSAGPQGAMGGGPKPQRNRKMLSLTDPNTGEDLTEKVFKPMSGEEMDPTVLESQTQAHREAVHLEFATKVAFLAKDKHTPEPYHPVHITAPPPVQQAPPPVHNPVMTEEPPVAALHPIQEPPQQHTVPMEQPPVPVVNGEPETNIPEQVISLQPTPPASYSTPAKKEFEPPSLPQPVETMAAAPEVQTPSPVQPAAPPVVMPASVPVAEMVAPVNVAPPQLPIKDVSPPPQVEVSPPPSVVEAAPAPAVEKSPPPHHPVVETPPPAAIVEIEPTPPVESAALAPTPIQSTSVSAADAAKVITEMATTAPVETSSPAPAQASAPQTQQPQPPQGQQQQQQQTQPQPQRDGKKSSKKHRRELNKKSKEGSDMDAFYDNQPQPERPKQESASMPAPREPSPKAAPPASVSPPPASTSPAAVAEAPQAAAAGATLPPEEITEPSTSAPEPEVTVQQPPPEPSPEPELANPVPEPAPAQPPAEVAEEPAQKSAQKVPSPVPQVEAEETAPEEVAQAEGTEEEAKENGDVSDSDMADVHSRLVNGLGLNYKEGQWSPLNPEGKKQYDREFLLKLQANPESRKAPDLPHMPEIVVDPRLVKTEDFTRAQMAASRSAPDFTPGFFKSFVQRQSGQSLPKRNSQQRGRGGPGSQSGEQQQQQQQQQRIIISTRQEVQLHKANNAYRPLFQQELQTGKPPITETGKLLRDFQSILNKLTPEKFSTLVVQIQKMAINTEERLVGVTERIFEKAIAEQKFAAVYADCCRELLKLPKVTGTGNKDVTFRGVLLTKCQKEFEKDNANEKDLENKKKELEDALARGAPQDETDRLKDELQAGTKIARYRSMGNIRFIGELFRLKMLTENIMHDCIFKLLKQRDDDSIECLTKLLDTVGADLDHPKAKQRMDQYFAQLEKMTADMRPPQSESGRDSKAAQAAASAAKAKDVPKLSSRVKFGVLDILDLRRNNWVKRRIHDMNKPTTLGAVHQKAKEEEQQAQFLNSQPRPQPEPSTLPRGGARPKGRGSAQGETEGGWNTVPSRLVKQPIDANKMKLPKQNMDINNVTLGGGNKFQNWGRGSQGGGSRSQEQEKMANRYTALNNLTDSDSRRGYGRSPARGDSRGSGRMDRDYDRRDRDRDRDYRKPVARSSMEERERAVASTRNMMGAVGGSNPSSRNGSRDNSRSRDTPPEAAGRKMPGLDASKMSADELDRRINTITEEFISNKNVKDTQESIAELRNLDHSMLVMTIVEKVVEKVGSARKQFGEFFFHMVREKQLSIEDLIKGLATFLEVAEDLELDVPKIWDYLAELMACLVVDNKVLPLGFLQACVQPLVAQGNKKEVGLITKIFKLAAEYKSKEVIQQQWAASGLKLSDFGLSGNELQWLKGPAGNVVYQELCSRLQRGESNDEISQWIDRFVKREEKESNQFARELFSAICRNSINERKQVNVNEVKRRATLIRKYLDTQEKGTQALFGVQHLMCELEHPQGMVRTFFELFYDEDMISEESFFDWEARDGPPEDMVGKGVVKMNLKSFFDWLRSSNEDERTS